MERRAEAKVPPEVEFRTKPQQEVCRLLEVAMSLPPRLVELRLAWSRWRRARRQ
jgi:hypothetical protein